MPYKVAVFGIEVAFAETQVIYGIEQIGFAHAVVAPEEVHLGRKRKLALFDISVVEYIYSFEYHLRFDFFFYKGKK